VISPLAFGIITDVTGSYSMPFVLSIALMGVGIVLAFWIRPDKPLVVRAASPVLSEIKEGLA
jgi:cyanate permease